MTTAETAREGSPGHQVSLACASWCKFQALGSTLVPVACICNAIALAQITNFEMRCDRIGHSTTKCRVPNAGAHKQQIVIFKSLLTPEWHDRLSECDQIICGLLSYSKWEWVDKTKSWAGCG